MTHIDVVTTERIAVLTLQRGKVNALNESLVNELRTLIGELSRDGSIGAVVLTCRGKFFSFGFDVPELYPLPRGDFIRFVRLFTDMYTSLYSCPKPVFAALNGHAIAGGCMIATACDRRLMAEGPGKISLNEVTFGASVFAGSVEMLRACAGQRNAERILLTGAMYSPQEAMSLGLVDRVVGAGELMSEALGEARAFASRGGRVFSSLKMLLRRPIVEDMRRREDESIREFVDIWYSESTRAQLRQIEIRK